MEAGLNIFWKNKAPPDNSTYKHILFFFFLPIEAKSTEI